MKPILLDKIASVTKACGLKREVRVSPLIPCEEGVVVVVRVLTDKHTYDQLELPSGRMARVKKGDVIAGALGHRHALFGYSGHIPERLAPGDRLHLLNLGGVLGICDAISPDLGNPFECEVIGTALDFPFLGERIGIPARVGNLKLETNTPLELRGVPVVGVVGTCMNAGKTAAACALIRALTHEGLVVDAFKATGVSLRRDILAMEDAGARHTAIFTDLGVVTSSARNSAAITHTLLNRQAAAKPDVIVVELGDGLLGAYGVDAILEQKSLRDAFTSLILAANDPVAAWGGVKLLQERYGLTPVAVTGPATDNVAGSRIIEDLLGVAALNARTHPTALAALVRRSLEERTAEASKESSGEGKRPLSLVGDDGPHSEVQA